MEIFELVEAYRRYDPAAKSRAEIAFLYPGVKSVLLHRVAHALYVVGQFFLARLVCEFSRWLTGIEIHPGAKLGRRLVIDHGMGVVIGETASVGNDCILFHGVTLGGVRFDRSQRHPLVGNRVLIGAGAVILGPVKIGDDSRIGANAVVTRDIDAGATVVGRNQPVD